MKKRKFIIVIFCFSLFCSCIVRAPKYTGIAEVLQLKTGMTKDEVSKTLGIPPYDIKSTTDKETIYIYKYRTADRKTFPFLMNKTNGVKAKGKWVDLFVSFDVEGKVTAITSCSDCEDTKVTEKKTDINSIIMLITISIPAVLVYIGLKTP